jgi:hypothetical protein
LHGVLRVGVGLFGDCNCIDHAPKAFENKITAGAAAVSAFLAGVETLGGIDDAQKLLALYYSPC